jgi:hypothetical protein
MFVECEFLQLKKLDKAIRHDLYLQHQIREKEPPKCQGAMLKPLQVHNRAPGLGDSLERAVH